VEKFTPFSLVHAAVLATIAVAILVAVRAPRHAVPTRVERTLGIAFIL
jgi:hypothetical protein